MRFTSITIENFKNVEYGKVDLGNSRIEDGPSILALYGQNGSGKSALVDSLVIFKCLLSGQQIPDRFAYYIRAGAANAKITYELEGTVLAYPNHPPETRNRSLTVRYEVEFTCNVNRMPQISFSSDCDAIEPEAHGIGASSDSAIRICAERLKGRWNDGGRFHSLFSSHDDRLIGPESFKELMITSERSSVANTKSLTRWAYSARQKCHGNGMSILAQPDLISVLYPDLSNDGGIVHIGGTDLQQMWHPLWTFATGGLFIVGTKESESIESGKLAFFIDTESAYIYGLESFFKNYERIKTDNPTKEIYEDFRAKVRLATLSLREGVVFVSTDPERPTKLPMFFEKTIINTLKSVSYVLERLVPGLTLSLNTKPITNSDFVNAYIVAKRANSELPLSCESRGIQKIVSICWLLINVYNNSYYTAVIDELDSGIFEYLLGEILELIAEEGQGQLIFTSHNLRPLEILDKGYIVFSTANQKNRYIRLKNVKTTNNLRDFYYRSILLGGQDESIYDPTSEGDLRMAFLMANETSEDVDRLAEEFFLIQDAITEESDIGDVLLQMKAIFASEE